MLPNSSQLDITVKPLDLQLDGGKSNSSRSAFGGLRKQDRSTVSSLHTVYPPQPSF
jgi:hypothetical protein